MRIIALALLLIVTGTLSARDSRLTKIRSSGIIRACINSDYEPFVIKNSKKGFPGFDIELLNRLAEFTGARLQIVDQTGIQEQISSVTSSKCDIAIGGISSSLERGRNVSFSNPYLITSPAALVLKSFLLQTEYEGDRIKVRQFRSLNDILDTAGLYFSVKAGTTNENYLRKTFSRSVISVFKSNREALAALEKNHANLMVADSLYIEALLQKRPSLHADYHFLLEPVAEEHISIILPRDDLLLLNHVNFFIKEMVRSGTVAELKHRYFNGNEWIVKQNQ